MLHSTPEFRRTFERRLYKSSCCKYFVSGILVVVMVFVVIVCRVFVSATIFHFDLNRAVTNSEFVFQHMRHVMKDLLAATDTLLGYSNMTAASNQARRNRPNVQVVNVEYSRHAASRLLNLC